MSHVARCVLVFAVVSGYTPAGLAQDPGSSAPFKRSTIELRGNIGGIDAGGDEVFDDLNDVDTAHAAFGYWLNLNQNFSIGASYLDGESDDFEFQLFSFFDDTVLEYNAVLIDVEGRLPVGRENYLFARAGVAFYDYDVIDDRDSATLRSDDGTDIHFAAGWTKSWNSGLGMEVLYEYLALGDDVEINTVGIGLKYSF